MDAMGPGAQVKVEDDEEAQLEAKTEADWVGRAEVTKKTERVHEVAGGRTDSELESFYREVHRKLREHYPASWLLIPPKQAVEQQLKKEKPEVEKEEQEMSEEEEQEELDKEEQEMEAVESLQKETGTEHVGKNERALPRRNPDRHSKRAKVDIKIESESGAKEGNMEVTTQKQKKQKTNVCGGQKTVLASLISTVLSQNTTDRNSSAAWANLKRVYKEDWERVRTAKPSDLADVIRTGGLAQRKGAIIQGLLNQLLEERGELSLEHLRDLPTEEVKQELTKYKGIGPKTASCVLMFNMKRADFPVDTHVHRVSTRLGFVRGTTREQTYEFMNSTMPDEIKRDMHVLLIRHGKLTCNARSPKCGECFLRDDCRYGQTLKKEKKLGIKVEKEEPDDDDDEEDKKEEEEEDVKSQKQGRRAIAKKPAQPKTKPKRNGTNADDDDFESARPIKKKRRVSSGGSPAKSNHSRRLASTKRRRSAPLDDIEELA